MPSKPKRKSTKRKSSKKSVVKNGKRTAGYAAVYRGNRTKTAGGLKKNSILKLKKKGVVKYVSKKRHAAGLKNPWIKAVTKARKELGIIGFVACKKGTEFYKLARQYFDK